jgi:TnpA family transposase
VHRRDALAAVLAIGCNLGCQRMELASGLSFLEISRVTDWYLTEETLKAAGIDIINLHRESRSVAFTTGAPRARPTVCASTRRFIFWGADYSHVLQGRGVTLYAHTSDHFLRMHQESIPCRLRKAAFSLDGLMEHNTELDPKVCYTDTHR